MDTAVSEQAAAITFKAQVFKLQTLIDGGVRLTLDFIEPIDTQTVVQLLHAKQPGIMLECAAVAIDESAPKKKRKQLNK